MAPRGDGAKARNGNGARLTSQQSVDQAIKTICDIMRRGNCAGAMQYVPELTWILFLRILDEKEQREAAQNDALGIPFEPSLRAPYRWRDWAAPPDKLPPGATNKRTELQDAPQNAFFHFVNFELLPYLKALKDAPSASPRQKIVSEIMTGVDRVRIDTERNFLDVVDKVDQLTADAVDPTHVFTLSQVYEGLLLKMGEKGNDGGQFFTPRQVIKAMVAVIDPKPGETIYDPGCGTGGFLAQSFEYVRDRLGNDASPDQMEALKQRAFWGREKENLVYPIALANLVLHGIDKPNLWHGNTLTGRQSYGGLFEGAPDTFDVVLTNPPFGGKEGKEARTNFDYKTGATQVLFLQHIIRRLRDGGRCGMVLDEGFLFRTNEEAFVQTKRKLLNDCDLWCVVSLPAGVFSAAGAGVKTNLLFFTRGERTRRIWYYDLTDVKVRKKSPMTLAHFADLLRLLPERAPTELSWTVDIDERRRVAAEAARPFKDEATRKAQQSAQWAQRTRELKKATPRDEAAIEDATTKSKELMRESREQAAKAKDIEDAVYDLKAVNPNRKPIVDTRTPEQLIAIIKAKGEEVAAALATLSDLLGRSA
jgi:type I restriction enzyme M protein